MYICIYMNIYEYMCTYVSARCMACLPLPPPTRIMIHAHSWYSHVATDHVYESKFVHTSTNHVPSLHPVARAPRTHIHPCRISTPPSQYAVYIHHETHRVRHMSTCTHLPATHTHSAPHTYIVVRVWCTRGRLLMAPQHAAREQ